MRGLSWVGAFLVAIAVVTSVGGIALARGTTGKAHLTASRHLVVVEDRSQDPPHVLVAPVPSPTPEQVTAPPAPASSQAAPPAAAPARPAIVIGSTQQALINQDRAARGLGPLTWSGCLYNVAVANARRIAAQGSLSHTNGPQVDLGCGLGSQAGENIGYWSSGVNDSQLNSMFVASPEHYANIVGPYHYVATAWVVAANGYGYIAVEFS